MMRLNDYVWDAFDNSKRHGFWEGQDAADVTIRLSKLALITSEVGEAIEAVRKADEPNFAEELADICIRVFDLAGANGINLEGTIIDKMAKNAARPFKHGKLA